MPADGIKAAHLAKWLGTSRLEQRLETIQHVLVCKKGDSLHFRKWHKCEVSAGPARAKRTCPVFARSDANDPN
jgi:hypothetical protein